MKQRFKDPIRAVALLLVMAFILVACGSEANPETTTTTQSETESPDTTTGEAPLDTTAPEPSAEVKELRVAQATDGLGYTSVYAARTMKAFLKEGVSPDFVVMGSSGPDVTALLGGNVDVAVTGGTVFMNSTAATNGEVVAIANVMPTLAYRVMVRNESAQEWNIPADASLEEKMAPWKGLIFGATRPGSLGWSMTEDLLRKGGLEPGVDVEIVGVGSGEAIFPALSEGKIDLTIPSSPGAEVAVKDGWATLYMDISEIYPNFIQQVIVTTRENLENNEEAICGFVRGIEAGNAFAKSATTEELAAALSIHFPDVEEPVLLDAIEFTQAKLKDTVRVEEADFDTTLSIMLGMTDNTPGLEDITFDASVDNRCFS